MGRQAPKLTDDQRRRAFLIVAAIVVGILLLTGLLHGSHSTTRRGALLGTAATGTTTSAGTAGNSGPRTTAPAPRIFDVSAAHTSSSNTTNAGRAHPPADAASTASPSATAPRANPSMTRASPAVTSPTRAGNRSLIMAHARKFVAAYLAYEVSPLNAQMRAALEQTATGPFARRLLMHKVDLPAGDRPAVATVRTLEFGGDADSSTVTVDATIDHAGWVSGLILDFQRADGRWLVSGLN